MSTDYLDMYGEKVASEVRKTIEAKVSSMCRRIVDEVLVAERGAIGTPPDINTDKDLDTYLSELFREYGLEYNKEDPPDRTKILGRRYK